MHLPLSGYMDYYKEESLCVLTTRKNFMEVTYYKDSTEESTKGVNDHRTGRPKNQLTGGE